MSQLTEIPGSVSRSLNELDCDISPDLLFDSLSFLVFLRINITSISVIGAFVALEASVSHFYRLFIDKNPFRLPSIKVTVILMALGSSFELIGCVVRAVYWGMGPLFSTSYFYYSTHIYLIYVPVALETLTTLLSVVLFHRWCLFGPQNSFFKRHLQALVAFVAALNFLLNFFLAILLVRFPPAYQHPPLPQSKSYKHSKCNPTGQPEQRRESCDCDDGGGDFLVSLRKQSVLLGLWVPLRQGPAACERHEPEYRTPPAKLRAKGNL